MIEWLIMALFATTLVYAIVIYNRLVRDRQMTRAGWSDIAVQLKRRHDLIPKLVDAVRQYASFEKTTLEHVTRLRSEAGGLENPAQQTPLENGISQDLVSIFALQEAYPDLKANNSFLQLQTDISRVEADIQFARRYYNGAARNLNTRIESFPDLLLARSFGFEAVEYFDFEESMPA